jgi:hypothetical protein
MNIPDTPIEVDAGTVPVAAAVRYIIAMLGTFAVGRGWVDADNVDGIVTVIITLGTVGYGLWRTHRRKADLVTAASAAPDNVAIIK